MAVDIFLSYSRADFPLAEQFVRTAAARGVNVWFDQQIEGGQDWREKIVEALAGAKALVILFSEHSNGSRQLIKELAIADKMRKLVIPVLVSNTEPQGAYLYEMASRNWINIHPNPETRLSALVDTLARQLELNGGSPPAAPVRGATAASAPLEETATATAIKQPAPPTVLAPDDEERWFPLGRYDFYILVPVFVSALLVGIFGKGDNKFVGSGFCIIASFIYMFVVGIRNARLNRSVFSGKSFASYFAVLAIGFSPVLLTGERPGESIAAFVGLIMVSLLLAVIANVVQVVLRKVFQRNIFHSRIEQPLKS